MCTTTINIELNNLQVYTQIKFIFENSESIRVKVNRYDDNIVINTKYYDSFVIKIEEWEEEVSLYYYKSVYNFRLTAKNRTFEIEEINY